jgi:hypothetical protein
VRLQGKGLLLGLRSPLALLMKLGVALKADIADCAVNVAIGRKAGRTRPHGESPESAGKRTPQAAGRVSDRRFYDVAGMVRGLGVPPRASIGSRLRDAERAGG